MSAVPEHKEVEFIDVPRAEYARLVGKPWLDVVSDADLHGWRRYRGVRSHIRAVVPEMATVYQGRANEVWLAAQGW
jgi:hypothetical protein